MMRIRIQAQRSAAPRPWSAATKRPAAAASTGTRPIHAAQATAAATTGNQDGAMEGEGRSRRTSQRVQDAARTRATYHRSSSASLQMLVTSAATSAAIKGAT